ncbi:hypothetical protein ITJ51_00875 [Curtobacterium flaccumfaciens]|nr:hypothetical protein [Curtobacterium flaccumfaciens]
MAAGTVIRNDDRNPMPSTRPIERFARRSYWRRRLVLQRWRLRLSGFQLAVRAAITEGNDQAVTSIALLRAALVPMLVCFVVWGGIETGSLWLRHHGADNLRWLASRVTQESYDGLLGAGIGATSTFLGLYWATVGVVASTVYSSVPGAIRNLFVSERSGTIFVRGTLYALVLGLLQLGFSAATGLHPTCAGLLVFTGLCGVSALWLVVLGGRLFNFFDSSTLASGLPQRFERAIRRAGARSRLPHSAADITAHAEAARVLTLLSNLAVLSAARPRRTDLGRIRIARYLLRVVTINHQFAGTIASSSAWWQRVSQHQNYFAIEHLRLTSALATSTGVPPTRAIDYQWVERRVAETLDDILAVMQTPAERGRAIDLLHTVAERSRDMGRRNLVAEALALREPLVAQATRFSTGTNPEEASVALAEAEPAVLQLTDLWLGFVDQCGHSTTRDLAADFTSALFSLRALYRSGLPREVITLAEELISKRRSETVIAGAHVTPMWWLQHHLARSLTGYLVSSAGQILDASEDTLRIARLLAARGDEQRAAVALLAALELSHKIRAHNATVQAHLEQLERFRSDAVSGDWPSRPPIVERAAAFRADIVVALSELLAALRVETHDSSRPDLYGQGYQVVTEAAWDYLLDDRSDTARSLFDALLKEFDVARLRASADFRDLSPELRFELTAEPLITAMDISGVAYLMQELNEHGIWDAVVAAWDDLLERGGQTLLRQLLIAGQLQDGFRFGPGQMVRTQRAIRLRQLLHDRGVGDGDGFSRLARRRRDPDVSPALQIFADTYGFHDRPWQYFFVEYVTAKLTDNETLPREVMELATQLDRLRDRGTDTTEED